MALGHVNLVCSLNRAISVGRITHRTRGPSTRWDDGRRASWISRSQDEDFTSRAKRLLERTENCWNARPVTRYVTLAEYFWLAAIAETPSATRLSSHARRDSNPQPSDP
jgi:hypothetical protein